MAERERILVIHDGPTGYLTDLRRCFPDCAFHLCHDHEDVSVALGRVEPSIVFALHGGRFKAFTHAPAVSAPGIKW